RAAGVVQRVGAGGQVAGGDLHATGERVDGVERPVADAEVAQDRHVDGRAVGDHAVDDAGPVAAQVQGAGGGVRGERAVERERPGVDVDAAGERVGAAEDQVAEPVLLDAARAGAARGVGDRAGDRGGDQRVDVGGAGGGRVVDGDDPGDGGGAGVQVDAVED